MSKRPVTPPKVSSVKKKVKTPPPLQKTSGSSEQVRRTFPQLPSSKKLQYEIKLLQSKILKAKNEQRLAEGKARAAKSQLATLLKQRDALKRAVESLAKTKRQKEKEAATFLRLVSKEKEELEAIRRELRQRSKEMSEAQGVALKAKKETERMEAQLAAAKRSYEELGATTAQAQARLDETTARIRDLGLTAALADFFLAADMDGLEKWIVSDTPIVLEYMKQVRDRPYFDVYREYLYSRLLRKAYRFYECKKCGRRFRAEDADPKVCPYCEATDLKLVDVAKEVVQEPPSSRLALPKPEEEKPKEGSDVSDFGSVIEE